MGINNIITKCARCYKKQNDAFFEKSSSNNSIYLYGDNPESHRWGVNLNEEDFNLQLEKLRHFISNNIDYKIVVGVRRTNFYKLRNIHFFPSSIRKCNA
jgi:hypothetical protein